MEMSRHLTEDRMERVMFIANHIGWGEIVLRWYDAERNHMQGLTSTGILMIMSKDESVLVTAYPCGIDKAYQLCKACDLKTIPSWLGARIAKNAKIAKKFGFEG